MIEIAVNGRFHGRRLSGVDRYATEITCCLQGRVRLIEPRRSHQGMRGHLWEQFVLPRSIRSNELLWSPANSGPVGFSRQVLSLHDVSVLEHPEWFSAGFALWYRLMLPQLARRARHILTVSEFSKAGIVRKLGIPAAKVTAVPNGVNLDMFRPTNATPVRRKYGLTQAYVLFVGSIDPRKNLQRLLEAWRMIPRLHAAELVIAGGTSRIFRRVEGHGGDERVRFLGFVPDADLPGLYSGANAFVMPSLYEGFGLTVLEAMACGTPVISSTAGALPEVADGAAILIDSTSTEALAEALLKVLNDDCLREELRASGLRRASHFTWERSARRIEAVLEANA